MLKGEDMRTQVGDKGLEWREGGRQVRSSKRTSWLNSSVRLKVMGCVVSLTSSVCSATDHVVESDSGSGSPNVHSQTWSQCQSRPATAA